MLAAQNANIILSNTDGWTMTEFNLGNSTDLNNQNVRSFELCVTTDDSGNSCETDR